MIFKSLLHILYVVLDAILRLMGSLLVIINIGFLQKLLGRYFFSAHDYMI